MEQIKSFAIFKNSRKENENQPDYKISAKIGDNFVEIGGAWIKEGAKGKFFSCKLSAPYKERKGYKLVEE